MSTLDLIHPDVAPFDPTTPNTLPYRTKPEVGQRVAEIWPLEMFQVSSLAGRARSRAGSNRPSSQPTLWACSQTWSDFPRTHLPSKHCVAAPHRSVTRSPSRPELEAMSRPPSEQVMAWPIPQG